MAGFNDWLRFDPAPMSAIERAVEVDEGARQELGRNIQTRLRARVDPGVRLQDALRAQAIRVATEGDRLVIEEEDQGAVLAAAATGAEEGRGDGEVNDVEQLFEMGSGVPEIIDGQLTYRSISLRSLFGEQKQGEQDEVVEGVVSSTIRDGVVDAYERATADVERKYPSR